MASRRSLPLYVVLSLAALLVACAEEEKKPAKLPAPEFIHLAFDDPSVLTGQTTRLRWLTKNATSLTVVDPTGLEEPVEPGLVARGSRPVVPSASGTWTVIAANEDGEFRAQASIGVRETGGKPAIASFDVTPRVVPAGGEVTFTWSTTNATNLRIFDAKGRELQLGRLEASGSATTRVHSPTTFTLRASNNFGLDSRSVDVAVPGAPVVSLSGPEEPILPGQRVRLRWATEAATNVIVTDEAGAILYEGPQARGDVEVSPRVATDYVLVATGSGGEASTRTTVGVRPVVDEFTLHADGEIRAGDVVEARWKVSGASHLFVQGLGAAIYVVPEEQIGEGSVELPVGIDGSFTLVARNGAYETTTVARLPISQVPRIVDMHFEPFEVDASVDLAAPVAVHWHIDGADTVRLIDVNRGEEIPVFGKSPRSDAVTAHIHETTTFRLEAESVHGATFIEKEIVAHAAPRPMEFTVFPARAEVGETVTIAWSTLDTESIRIEKDGADLGISPSMLNGTFQDIVVADATYVLKTFNARGFEVEAPVREVVIGSPEILSFGARLDVVRLGHDIEFSWQNAGGQHFVIREGEGGQIVCEIEDLATIAEGGCDVATPATTGDYVYEATLTSGLGNETKALFAVRVTDGPVIESTTMSPTLITVNQPITLRWIVSDDMSGAEPSLTLVDSLEGEINISGADPHEGTFAVVPRQPGVRTYTLTATTPGTLSHSVGIEVDVRGVPEVTLGADPVVADSGGTGQAESTLEWTVAHGESITIHALEDGEITGSPVFSSNDPAEVAAGAFPVQLPAGFSHFRLTADNGAGTLTFADVTVGVDVATAELLADTTSTCNGCPVTFTWTTERADEVKLDIPEVEWGNEPMIPVLSLADGQQHTLGQDSGWSTINFPAGFEFPWQGVDQTKIQVETNGVLSFSSASLGISNSPGSSLPYTTTANEFHLMPFWDDMHTSRRGGVTHGSLLTGYDSVLDAFVIQWDDMDLWSSSPSSNNGTSVTFQVLLYRDGTFEYRYGDMIGAKSGSNSSNNQARADGANAAIGFRTPSGPFLVSFHRYVSGGLSGKSLRFDPRPAPPNGTRVVPLWTASTSSSGSRTVTLSATNVHNTAISSKSVSLPTSWPDFNYVNYPTGPFNWGDVFSVSYSASNVQRVELVSPTGDVVASSTSTSSTFNSVITTYGQQEFILRLIGSSSTQGAVLEFPIAVDVPPAISFEATPETFDVGEPVTLSWSVAGAAMVSLSANGVPIDVSALPLQGASIVVNPSQTTTYELTLYDAELAPIAVASAKAQIRDAAFSSLAVAAPSSAGGAATVSWVSDGSMVTIEGAAPVIASDTATLVDITATGTEITGFTHDSSQRFDFPAGFTFWFDGAPRNFAWVASDGWIGFNPTGPSEYSNQQLPYAGERDVHLAVFWDDLFPDSGHVYYDVRDDGDPRGRYLVIHWDNWRVGGSSSSLNFQALLYETGDFEYRYGTMSYSTQTRADGSSATIGYQGLRSPVQGHTISHNTAVPGGLSGKRYTFKVSHGGTGSASVVPNASGIFYVCVHQGDFKDCQQQQVPRSGAIMISEIMAAPGGSLGSAGEWFEVRNTTAAPMAMDGWTIESGSGESFTVPAGTTVEPGGVITFARSDSSGNGGFVPHVVYGNALSLDDGADDQLVIKAGDLVIDKVSWTSSWFPTGQSRVLDPSRFDKDSSNDAVGNWCTPSSSYATDNFGTPNAISQEDACRSAGYAGSASTYYWMDLASGYEYIDLDDVAHAASTLPDNTSGDLYVNYPLGVGFDFPFFGTVVSGTAPVAVSSEGFISFSSISESHYSNLAIPSSSTPNGLIAAFWDDLAPGRSNALLRTALLHRNGMQVRIYQWSDWVTYSSSLGTLNFQIQLWENGDIVTAYKDATATGTSTTFSGSGASVGIESTDNASGIEFGRNSSGMIRPGMAIAYKRK